MIKSYVVRGHSMEPNFCDADKLLVSSMFFSLKKGDVVVFGSGGRNYIKRITEKVGKDKFFAAGDNSSHGSIHSISRRQIKGKLLMKF